MAALDGIESDWRSTEDSKNDAAGGGYYPVTSSWLSYGSSYIGTIVENLQLEVKDVHLRFEDDSSGQLSQILAKLLIKIVNELEFGPNTTYQESLLIPPVLLSLLEALYSDIKRARN